MATIQANDDKSISLVLSDIERATFDKLPVDQLSAFITQWLMDKSVLVFKDRFIALTDQQKSDVLTMMQNLSDGKVSSPSVSA